MLPGCLRCLAFADEVVVAVDSRSTARTVAIAEASGARVLVIDFQDFGTAKEAAQQAIEADWVLAVDADERISADLAREIRFRTSSASPKTIAFRIPRRNYFYGQEMKHGGWANEASTRLFRRNAVSYRGQVHETTRAIVPGRTDTLQTPLIHFTHRSVEQSLEKDWQYADLGAAQLLESGAPQVTTSRMLKRVARQFVRRFVVKRGWKDGLVGVVEVFRVLAGDLTTRMRLWELQREYNQAETYRQLDSSIEVAPATAPAPLVPQEGRPRQVDASGTSVSVCLCTYNGERFLEQQLDSLVAQARPPNELVVVDDGSSDGTMDILERFEAQAPFPVRMLVHQTNQGLRDSYTEAISAATSTVIFPCDQNDVWLHDKIGRLAQELQNRPEAAGAFCNSELITVDGQRLATTLWNQVGFTTQERLQLMAGEGLSAMLRHFGGVAAHALAFRADRRKDILPLSPHATHDAWSACVLMLDGGLYAVDDCLVEYRQHSTNYIGGVRRSKIERLLKGQQARVTAFEMCCALQDLSERLTREEIAVSEDMRELIETRIEQLQFRSALSARRLSRLGALPAGYKNGLYSVSRPGITAAILDLLRDGTPLRREIGPD
jgi:glycosyltransferase involved in cell wall biosynthesis